MQSLMNTPIIQFSSDSQSAIYNGTFSPGAVRFFCVTTLPLMLFTFLGWWIPSHMVKLGSKEDREKGQEAAYYFADT